MTQVSSSSAEDERRAAVAWQLLDSFDRPLTAPGSERLFHGALSLTDVDDRAEMLRRWVGKVLETLDDGARHDTLAVPDCPTPVAIWFNTWSGTVDEVWPQRVGSYVGPLLRMAQKIVSMRGPLTGFLQIDAYVRDEFDDGSDPDEGGAVAIDVEYSHVPGHLLGGTLSADPLWRTVMLNLDLCSDEERQALTPVMT